jgi:ferric-dicitrate binding protein FerR (iron transport regulator)
MKGIDLKIVSAFIQGVCTDDMIDKINAWMDEDEFNKEWLFNLKALYDNSSLDYIDDAEYIRMQYEKTWEKIYRISNSNKLRKRRLQRIFLYTSVACLLGFVFVYGLFYRTNSTDNYIVETVSSADSIRRIMLPDETVVWLNSNSTIKYLPEFDDDVRRVLLAGESYFEVAKDESRPFIVETSDFTVEVLGTEFNVSAYEDVEFSDATLVKGQIVIENKRNKKEIELLPGQKVRISKSNNEMLVSEVDVNNEILWKSEFITFEQERIIHIISKLEYIYGVKIALEHDPNEIYTYSGAVTRKGSIDEVLASLQNVIPFSFMKTKDGYLVIL